MLNYLFRRLTLLFITGLILTVITFIITVLLTYDTTQNNHYIVEYFHYLGALLQGQWGVSSLDQQSILMKGWLAFSSTLEICFIAFIAAIAISVPLGILAALNRNRLIDYLVMAMVLICLALPVFCVALFTMMIFEYFSISLPAVTHVTALFAPAQTSGFLMLDTLLNEDTCTLGFFCEHLMRLFLSAAVLAIFLISEITRLTRHSITSVMKTNYIKAAYAKGLSSWQLITNHVFKNALPVIINQIRLQLSTIISFAMVIEIVLSMPGTGTWVLTSINAGDYLALPTAVLLISGFTLIASLFIDLFLVFISPVTRKSLYVD